MRYNPKSHAPAVYIPAWLIQISSKKLSFQAKILYGRLAQWSNTKGIVHRSSPQLAQEIGCEKRAVERYLKELRDVKLIETYQVKQGGENHYRFLDHEWIHAELEDVFNWGTSNFENAQVPPDKNVGTPPTKMSVLK